MSAPPTIFENGADLITLAPKRRPSARGASATREIRIDAEVKSWLDSVIIPNLVRQYLLEKEEFKAIGKREKTEVEIDPGASYAQDNSER